MEREIRKARSNLMLCGVGSAAFGIWLFLKNILYLLFAGSYLSRVYDLGGDDPGQRTTVLIWLGMSFLAMLLHLFIGLRAIREAKGNRTRKGYLFLAGVFFLGNAAVFVCTLAAAPGAADYLDLFCDLMLQAARAINFAALVLAARKLRKLRREEGREEKHAD